MEQILEILEVLECLACPECPECPESRVVVENSEKIKSFESCCCYLFEFVDWNEKFVYQIVDSMTGFAKDNLMEEEVEVVGGLKTPKVAAKDVAVAVVAVVAVVAEWEEDRNL